MPKVRGVDNKIKVGFRGAVKNGGRISLVKSATIQSGLNAAGGLAKPTEVMWPAGIIRVRRRQNGRMSQFCQFDMSDVPAEWERFKLQDGDEVIFQWHVVTSDA